MTICCPECTNSSTRLSQLLCILPPHSIAVRFGGLGRDVGSSSASPAASLAEWSPPPPAPAPAPAAWGTLAPSAPAPPDTLSASLSSRARFFDAFFFSASVRYAAGAVRRSVARQTQSCTSCTSCACRTYEEVLQRVHKLVELKLVQRCEDILCVYGRPPPLTARIVGRSTKV